MPAGAMGSLDPDVEHDIAGCRVPAAGCDLVVIAGRTYQTRNDPGSLRIFSSLSF